MLFADIYDIFKDVRMTSIDMSGTLCSIGVALASLLASFYLLNIAAKLMSGKGGIRAYDVVRPFIIIIAIMFLKPIMSATDSFMTTFTTPIRKSTNIVVDSLTCEVAKTIKAIDDFDLKTGRTYSDIDVYRFLSDSEKLRAIFAEEGVPEQLAALTLVESDFKAKATSSAGARGYYQFMPETARGLGLRVDDEVDEREDLEKSARASARYLNSLYQTFHSWPLALAAYNAGEGNVRKAQTAAASSGQRPEQVSFTQAYQYLPQETQQYIPNFVSMAEQTDRSGKAANLLIRANNIIAKHNVNGTKTEEILYGTPKNTLKADYSEFVDSWGLEMDEIAKARYFTSSFWGRMKLILVDYYFVGTIKAGWAIIVAFINWLADNVYLIIDAWANLTLILLIFLAPFIFAFSVLPNYKNGISSFFARYIQVSLWEIIGGVVAWASATARLGFYNLELSSDLQANTINQMNQEGLYGNGAFTAGVGLATVFLMFQVPTIASYIISSSGANGLMNNLVRSVRKGMQAPGNKLMNDASTAINTRIDINRLKRYRKVHDANKAVIAAGGTPSYINRMRENFLKKRLKPANEAILNQIRLNNLTREYNVARDRYKEAEKLFNRGAINKEEFRKVYKPYEQAKNRLNMLKGKMDTPQTLTKKVSKQLYLFKNAKKELKHLRATGKVTKEQYAEAMKELNQKFAKYINLSHL